MDFSDNIHSSLRTLRQNKIRSSLTMLGIIIGIMGVIVIISAGSGAQSMIINQIKSQGSNLVAIFPGSGDKEGPPVSVMGIVITTLKYEDIKALKDPVYSPLVEVISGYVRGSQTVSVGGSKTDTSIVGVSASLPIVEDTAVAQGNFFTEEDEKTLQKVAVLGVEVRENLFQDDDPIGKLIKIGKSSYRVVGVMRSRGATGFANQDNQIFIPVTTAQKLFLGIEHVSFGRAKIKTGGDVDKAMEDIRGVLRERHGIQSGQQDDFDVRSQKDAISVLLKVTGAIKFFLTAVAGIALLVGGIGVMNIMLVAVEERVREVGLRKAVGADKRDIMGQFLVETIIITSIAGIIGIVMGVAVSYLISFIVRYIGYDWDFSISLSTIVLAVGTSSIIGLIFGLVPARRAGRLNPVEALHYE